MFPGARFARQPWPTVLASHPYTAIVRRGFPRHISLAFLVFFAPAARPFFADGTGSWVPTGPDGGNVNALSLDPSSPLTVYAGASGGVFRTRDAGAQWTHVGPKDVSVNDLAVPISEPSMVYSATAAGLFRSDDGGTSWRRLQVAAPTESIDNDLRGNRRFASQEHRRRNDVVVARLAASAALRFPDWDRDRPSKPGLPVRRMGRVHPTDLQPLLRFDHQP